MNTQYALRIGLDWADQKHDLAIMENGAENHLQIASTPEAIDDFLNEMRRRHPDGRFAICLEQTRGTLFFILSKYDFIDLYSVNPTTMGNYRKAFSTSGAKSDMRDAHLLLELLECHRESLRCIEADTAEIRELRALCESRRRCVDVRTRLTNALLSLLKTIFPQALELCGDKLYGRLSLDFLKRWHTLPAFKRSTKKTVVQFFKTHRAGQEKRLERVEEIRRSGLAATEDPAIVEPAIPMLEMLLEQICATNLAIEKYESRTETVSQEIAESEIFASFPGAGKAMAPRLTAAFGSDRERWGTVAELQSYAGVAPVTEASGKSRWVHWRWSCPKFLRQTFVEYAKESLRQSDWARVYYDKMRARGNSHNQALRALAWKWTRILWRCWKTGEHYDETRYLAALKKQGSWIAKACHA